MNFFRTVGFAADCIVLRSGIDSIQGWWSTSRMKHNSEKTTDITFTRRLKPLTTITKLYDK